MSFEATDQLCPFTLPRRGEPLFDAQAALHAMQHRLQTPQCLQEIGYACA